MKTEPFETLPKGDSPRRRFLKSAATAALSMSLVRPGGAFAQSGADRKADLNVGLVGFGAQGQVLTESLVKIPGVRIVAICDIWEYRRRYAERLLKRYGQEVQGYEDYRVLLEKESGLDAVIVATPDFWHAPVTNDALQAGKHVYCEKMMSNTVEGARSMVRTMRETGKLLQIGHQRRSNPRYLIARNRLLQEAKLLGRITAANGQWNRAVSEDLGWPQNAVIPGETLRRFGYANMHEFRNWRWYKKYGGGPLSDLGAHQIDIFNWFFGTAPRRVIGSGGKDYYPNHEWFDQAMVVYEYDLPEGVARAFYQVLTTTSAGGGYFERFMGVEGTLKMSENPKYTTIYREASAPSWDEWVRRRLVTSQTVPSAPAASTKVDARETAELDAYALPVVLEKAIHQPHLENFFAAIRGEASLNCPADEAFHSEMAVFKAMEAVESGLPVEIRAEDLEA